MSSIFHMFINFVYHQSTTIRHTSIVQCATLGPWVTFLSPLRLEFCAVLGSAKLSGMIGRWATQGSPRTQ